MRSLIQRGGIVLAASFALACGGAADAADAASSASSAGAADAEGAADAARGGVSDSTSMQAGLARYQAALAAHPTAFDGSLATPEDVARELRGSLAAPDTAKAMRPLGDTFINLVKMVVGPIVFLTIVVMAITTPLTINNGVTVAEIQEVLLQAAIYCGVPAALDAFKVAKEVLEQK